MILSLTAINAERKNRGKPALMRSVCLEFEAQKHAETMRLSGKLTHAGWEGRIAACGYEGGSENVAFGFRTIADCIAGWMRSRGHKRNILGDWSVCGFAKAGSYWCAIFA